MAKQPRRGGIVQERAPVAGGWTKARKLEFVGLLAQTCNVAATCRTLGTNSGSAYKRRAIDAVFARQWEWALQQGYVRLKGELLNQAMGSEALDEAADALGMSAEQARPVDTELGLKLLALRGKADQAGRRKVARVAHPSAHEVLEALDKRLAVMEKRLGRGA